MASPTSTTLASYQSCKSLDRVSFQYLPQKDTFESLKTSAHVAASLVQVVAASKKNMESWNDDLPAVRSRNARASIAEPWGNEFELAKWRNRTYRGFWTEQKGNTFKMEVALGVVSLQCLLMGADLRNKTQKLRERERVGGVTVTEYFGKSTSKYSLLSLKALQLQLFLVSN